MDTVHWRPPGFESGSARKDDLDFQYTRNLHSSFDLFIQTLKVVSAKAGAPSRPPNRRPSEGGGPKRQSLLAQGSFGRPPFAYLATVFLVRLLDVRVCFIKRA